MREPGLGNQLVPDAEQSLPWLAQAIVQDPRFAQGVVKFWWPALFGEVALLPPEVETDETYDADLIAFTAQNQEIQRLAELFREGINGGSALNLKDLLVEMVMSPWFRAGSHMVTDTQHLAALASVGSERILTPEQLGRKTAAVTGVHWRNNYDGYTHKWT